ncbi:MAG: AAA family ATPase [Thermoplasmatales archaeon]|jgi:energy-coupling factor transporter ATP-binding protein EcfA2|nr:ATP-binding protein [Candidatus Thermoplasmatota archaeon]MDA8054501.1 AAA family ATPase [Thermoplasmatales archaeon]
MKFIEFKFRNFKGIRDVTFYLDKSPRANIYTLVGLNESGKTTLLEAISNFDPQPTPTQLPVTTLRQDPNAFIPLSLRDNFNGEIVIEATLQFDSSDLVKINSYARANTSFKEIENVKTTWYSRNYSFLDSKFKEENRYWNGLKGKLKGNENGSFIDMWKKYNADWHKLDEFILSLIPTILYFPNFLFDFPSRIYLQTIPNEKDLRENFYIDLIQDILYSLENKTYIDDHLIKRIMSDDANDKRNLKRLLQLMEAKVTKVVFGSWNEIFKRKVKDSRIKIESGKDSSKGAYLEFNIEAQDGIYNINDRSLGFRWFFAFLIFTQFRPYREASSKNLIYLFDEPASNLHSSAQRQLLNSFERFGENVKIIYTTHSHHMINPRWLESTYIVENDGIDLESPESNSPKGTNIQIERYREFVSKFPQKTDYFQPVLEVLDYRPSDLEKIPNCIFLEGKNDYYTLTYFNEIVFYNKYKTNLMPGMGSGDLNILISLYLGWGKNFMALLDSDKAGDKEKERYIEKFGSIVEGHIFTLSDIDTSWSHVSMDELFIKDEAFNFQKMCFPDSTILDKKQFNRAIQEFLATKRTYVWSKSTCENMEHILHFLTSKLE